MKRHDPLHTFISLKVNYPEAFFFESTDVSVIGLDRSETIRLVGDNVLVTNRGETKKLNQDFLTYLTEKLNNLALDKGSFPYEHGGAFGCLGYEFVALLEPKLLKTAAFKSSFESDEVVAEIFLSQNLIVFEHASTKVHLALRSLSVNPSEFKFENESPVAVLKIEDNFESLKASMGKERFFQNVKQIKSHIKAGDIFQAVLSERFELKTKATPLQVYQSVRNQCVSTYSFYFDFKESSFFGASPETLVKIKEGILETHPIAGTRPRGLNKKSDELFEQQLNRSVKEGAEHLMLVDLARNDLGRVAKPGTIKIDVFRKLLRLSNVMHLVSVVKGQKRSDKTDFESLNACFPAGTLTGAPKVRAMEIISGLENRPRGFYGGAVIAIDHGGDLDSCIAIRSVEMKNQTVILRAGAGVVADSQAEKEYSEIKHKLKSLLTAVRAAELV